VLAPLALPRLLAGFGSSAAGTSIAGASAVSAATSGWSGS
jgi:hypothetical protein